MFSKLSRTTVKTIRFYDEVGLLKPSKVDEWTGYRYYKADQLFDLYKIVSLRQMGFSIPEIKDIISGRDVSEILSVRKNILENEHKKLSYQLSALKNFIKGAVQMNQTPVIKEIPRCIVASHRTVIPNYDALYQVVPDIAQKMAKFNPKVKYAEPEYSFQINHDKEYKESDVDIEICRQVQTKGSDVEGLVFKEMPATKVVSLLHKGHYHTLGQAYANVIKWIEENGYKINGEIRQSHIKGHWNCEDSNEWLTELQVPVE